MSDSDDSWDTNGYLKIFYRNQGTSGRLTSTFGTRFDNFSGTDERNLTQYWQTQAELRQPLFAGISGFLNCGYSNENRDEVTTGMETEVDLYSAGAGLDYQLNDQYSVGLSYGYEKQDSEFSADSYDEHKGLLTLSYKTDLLKW